MKKYFLLGLVLFATHVNAQINKIDHFFLSSPKADTLFNLFKNELGLPTDWDYESWGDFSSGAVSLGNVAFEFVYYDGVSKTSFDGIALEPKQTVEEIIEVLDNAQVMHDTIVANTFVMSNGKIGGWSNMGLENLLPDEAGLFICDYKNREQVSLFRQKSSVTLKNNNGGPLGVLFLEEIVMGSTNFSMHKNELAKLPGINLNKDNVYSFKDGPSIRLTNSSANGFEKIVIKVHSVDEAKKYLKSKNLIGKSSMNSVFIDPKALDGLTIELVDK